MWIITGGAGFIGSHFVDLLAAKGERYVNLDLLTYAATRFDDHLIQADISSSEQMREVIGGYRPSVIVNFAAESHVDNSYRQSRTFLRTNVGGVVTLLEAVRDLAPGALFVQISTDEVFGDSENPSHAWDKMSPSNPYAATKAAAEHMVWAFSRSFNLDFMITRSSNNWGPRQHREKFIPAALHAKDTGIPMVVHGYDLRRDWLHVHDNVSAIYQLIKSKGVGVWNVATERQYTLKEVLDRIGDVPHILSSDRPGVDRGYWVKATPTWETLGWRPQDFMKDDRWDSYVEGEAE